MVGSSLVTNSRWVNTSYFNFQIYLNIYLSSQARVLLISTQDQELQLQRQFKAFNVLAIVTGSCKSDCTSFPHTFYSCESKDMSEPFLPALRLFWIALLTTLLWGWFWFSTFRIRVLYPWEKEKLIGYLLSFHFK